MNLRRIMKIKSIYCIPAILMALLTGLTSQVEAKNLLAENSDDLGAVVHREVQAAE